jgi:hypothetical protein
LAIDLLDAMSAQDGPRLQAAFEASMRFEEFYLPLALRTIAGMLALELQDADAATRHAFAEEHMMEIGNGPDSEDVAYQVLRAYVMRP